MNNDCLMHYGIIGMKWGIRRYQNYDGSYTKKGLDHYNKSKAKYDADKETYKTVKSLYKISKRDGYVETSDGRKFSVEKSALNQAKGNYKSSKRKLSRDYRQLKLDKRADKGKSLYQRGNTITSLTAKEFLGGMAITGITTAGMIYANNHSMTILNRHGTIPVADLIKMGGYAALGANFIAREVQKERVRAYYTH